MPQKKEVSPKVYAARRKRLIEAVRRHKKSFNMSHFLIDNANFVEPRDLEKFCEDKITCKTICCLAGMAHILWPKLYKKSFETPFSKEHQTAIAEWLGLKNFDDADLPPQYGDGQYSSPAFYVTSWPTELQEKYLFTRAYNKIKIAEKALNHFAKHTVSK